MRFSQILVRKNGTKAEAGEEEGREVEVVGEVEVRSHTLKIKSAVTSRVDEILSYSGSSADNSTISERSFPANEGKGSDLRITVWGGHRAVEICDGKLKLLIKPFDRSE